MLNENLKRLRQKRGFTQEELAVRLHVVRQTVSKWEKGLSVPDADMLQNLADILEVNVTELLGAPTIEPDDRNEVAQQLARINEQMAIKNRRAHRIWKTVAIVLITSVVLITMLTVLNMVDYRSVRTVEGQTITQEMEGEE